MNNTYYVEINFHGNWARVPKSYDTRSNAEWDIGLWKQSLQIRDDSFFRVVCIEA